MSTKRWRVGEIDTPYETCIYSEGFPENGYFVCHVSEGNARGTAVQIVREHNRAPAFEAMVEALCNANNHIATELESLDAKEHGEEIQLCRELLEQIQAALRLAKGG